MTRSRISIDEAVVVITGASSGIGRVTARTFADRGARVVLAARSESSLREAADECEAAGGQALPVVTDVTESEAVQELARRAIERFGHVDVWVNNAASMVFGKFTTIPEEVHRHIIDTNLVGQIRGARAILPHFEERQRGVLINVASLYAKLSSPYVSAYVTSKYAVRGFSEVIREEVEEDGDIHVVTVLPASVDTPIFRHAANYTGRKPKPVPPVSDPRRVARAIVRSAERPRRQRVVGQGGRLMSWGHALFPPLYDVLVPAVMDMVGLRNEPAEDSPGNVFEPMSDLNQTTGGWRRRRKRFVRAAAPVAVGLLWWGLRRSRVSA